MADGPPGAPTLIAIMDALGLAPHELQTFDPAYSRFDAQRPLLVLDEQFVAARPVLGDRYPARTPARAVVRGAVRDGVAVADLPEDADAWLLPALPPERDSRALAGLRGVMERLYAPDGCPWDREQTHESLRRYFLDEAYELVDAIDHGDVRGLEEEIGDVFAHLFMQTALAQLAGAFTVEDVVAHASAKFVRRHPHVFGDEAAGSQEALLDRWEQIKAAERAERGEAAGAEAPEGALDSVPAAAPALQRASALIGRALRAGVTRPRAEARAELVALAGALPAQPNAAAVGALLWSVVRVAREADVDAEEALRAACARFIEAVAALEREARARGHGPSAVGADALSATWGAVTLPGE